MCAIVSSLAKPRSTRHARARRQPRAAGGVTIRGGGVKKNLYTIVGTTASLADGSLVPLSGKAKTTCSAPKDILRSPTNPEDALKKCVLDLVTKKGNKTELQLGFRKPAVIIIVGVNGGGKTTSLGKLAHRLKKEGAKFPNRGSKGIFLRDSRLTFLLRESLGGNAKLAMVCAISHVQRGIKDCNALARCVEADRTLVLTEIIALFVDRGGMQRLLLVPRVAQTFFGLSSCLFAIGSLQAPTIDRYLHDLLQYALGVLHVVTLVPSDQPIVNATLSNDRVGIAVILDATNGAVLLIRR
ncbi:hypothetical protein LOK49_LG10G00033 [Camellia lanceoleosa]|uniref:Uncharacterized protein n=1 Tax=Camellia lanceoleosa TaxID=1840588 RepID=A0ACC0GB01_9ERIC|nr:hypothetical protein LOK49_LG10G00033 [Camellia lanceoleosa]